MKARSFEAFCFSSKYGSVKVFNEAGSANLTTVLEGINPLSYSRKGAEFDPLCTDCCFRQEQKHQKICLIN